MSKSRSNSVSTTSSDAKSLRDNIIESISSASDLLFVNKSCHETVVDSNSNLLTDKDKELRLLSLLRKNLPYEAFERITNLAARFLKCPVAVISIVDEKRQFYNCRLSASCSDDENDFRLRENCHGVLSILDTANDDVLNARLPAIVAPPTMIPSPRLISPRGCISVLSNISSPRTENAQGGEKVATSGNVNSSLSSAMSFSGKAERIRFFAATNIFVGDIRIGSLMVYDTMPHPTFSVREEMIMEDLAGSISDILQERRVVANSDQLKALQSMHAVWSHLKAPLLSAVRQASVVGSSLHLLESSFRTPQDQQQCHTGNHSTTTTNKATTKGLQLYMEERDNCCRREEQCHNNNQEEAESSARTTLVDETPPLVGSFDDAYQQQQKCENASVSISASCMYSSSSCGIAMPATNEMNKTHVVPTLQLSNALLPSLPCTPNNNNNNSSVNSTSINAKANTVEKKQIISLASLSLTAPLSSSSSSSSSTSSADNNINNDLSLLPRKMSFPGMQPMRVVIPSNDLCHCLHCIAVRAVSPVHKPLLLPLPPLPPPSASSSASSHLSLLRHHNLYPLHKSQTPTMGSSSGSSTTTTTTVWKCSTPLARRMKRLELNLASPHGFQYWVSEFEGQVLRLKTVLSNLNEAIEFILAVC